MSRKQQFFMSRADGSVALWSLHNPVNPVYGHWAWGAIVRGRVKFIRPMTDDEILVIRRSHHVWGRKIHKQHWALVVGSQRQESGLVNTYHADKTGGVGV